MTCNNLRNHLKNICLLHGLNLLHNECLPCYESGYFRSTGKREISYSEHILETIKVLNARIRPYIIPLMEECFRIRDNHIVSAVGNSYGDIYEQHLEWAVNSRMNKKNDENILEGYLELMQPILKGKL